MKFTYFKPHEIETPKPNGTEIVIESYRRKVTLISRLDMVLMRGFIHIAGLARKSNILVIESSREVFNEIGSDFLKENYSSEKKLFKYANGSRLFFLQTSSIGLMPNLHFDLIVVNHDKFEECHIGQILLSLYPEKSVKYGRLVVFNANSNLLNRANGMDGWIGYDV